jgi:hypothetical protein
VANKSGNDDKIAEALFDMKNCLPRLNDLANIYLDRRLEAFVAEVYEEVIIFARESVIYYSKPSSRRLYSHLLSRVELTNDILLVARALTPPAHLGVNRCIERLCRKLEDVRSEGDILLHKTINTLVQENEERKRQLAVMEEQNRSLLSTLAGTVQVNPTRCTILHAAN